MKKLLLVAFASLCLFTASYAEQNDLQSVAVKEETCRQPKDVFIVSVQKPELSERSGCCSWHGGVCGCSSNRAVCCDGKLSPTCGCD